ncbi:uncharacterized protein [Epargyreus clarus]|uniref:uncharacterized protein n=1 Tax=Epargyreus clarus TaxID=520877 RepID=UPI003C30B353
MEEKAFIWTPELNKRLIQFRIDHDYLFKKKKQPWGEFYKILIENGFPDEMTINHVRKKWSYMYDTYKIAKKAKNKNWKYYKMFEKLFGRTTILDKYESWSDEWRLKLIASICEAKTNNLDYRGTWKAVEKSLRLEELPLDCCIQDIKGLWQHIRMTFNRKHRLKVKKNSDRAEWALYDAMMNYFQKFEPDYLSKLESDTGINCLSRERKSSKNYLNKNFDKKDDQTSEFQWSKDITESFIQIRLQNDWLFRERKWAWNDLLNIMREEYGFPNTLTGRDICRKWAATFSEYQKAKATNNNSWVYHKLFELYLGEGNLSLNPTVGWKEEWIFNLINIQRDCEHLFRFSIKDNTEGWREVEKRMRKMGLPLDHSLLELPEVWAYMLKTYRWKRKFADKGILSEQWPFYEAMAAYINTHSRKIVRTFKQKRESVKDEHFDDCDRASDDEVDEELKLTELKEKLHEVRPKLEFSNVNYCRTCSDANGSLNIFSDKDDEGVDLAEKLKIIGGVEVVTSDNLPSQICINCARELENAYKFRRKCQESDKKFRNSEIANDIKTENHVEESIRPVANDDDEPHIDQMDSHCDDLPSDSEPKRAIKTVVKKERIIRPGKKRGRKPNYHYWKVCEVCGKYTKNLVAHLDTHSSSKEHACNVCDKKFKFRSGLLIHKAVHDPTPKKTCEICGKTFHVIAQYRKHFVYHANERKFGCETCGKRFNTMDILRVHTRIHTNERPFTCDECGKTFRTAGCVGRHKRIVHRKHKMSKAENLHFNLRLWWTSVALILIWSSQTQARDVTNEDIRDAIMSLVHMFRSSEDKLERHEYREKALGDMLKKMISGLEKKHRALEPLKGMISRLDERIYNVENIFLQKEEREKATLKKTYETLGDIQTSLQSLTAVVTKNLKPSGETSALETNLTEEDETLSKRLDATDAKLDAVRKEIEDLKNSLNKDSLRAMCLEVSSDINPLERHISEAEKLLNKYELKLNEYGNATKVQTDFVPLSEVSLADEAWHSKMTEVMERQETDIKKIQKLLSDAESMWKDLPRLADLHRATNHTIESFSDLRNNLTETSEKSVLRITTKLREMNDRLLATNEDIQQSLTQGNTMSERAYGDISRSYDTLRAQIEEVSKNEHVMLQTADTVISTKKLVEYGVHQILVEVGQLIMNQGKTLNKTMSARFDRIAASIADNQTYVVQNVSGKIETEMAQVWRQIGIMYQQLTASKGSLDKLTERMVQYVNDSTSTMDSMKGKVGLITARMLEVDDNLNYLLGRLSLVTQEFAQIKVGLGDILEKAKSSLHEVQEKIEDKGPGPHKTED